MNVVFEEEHLSNDNHIIENSTFPSNTVYVRKPLYALVELPRVKLTFALTDLKPTVIPIVPQQKSIRVDVKACLSPTQKRFLHNKTSITITRSQLRLILAYAMTAHKCQGKTLPCGIIDIAPPPYAKPDLAQVYVRVSRFPNLDSLAILRPFPRSVLNQKPDRDLLTELKRLEMLDTLADSL